jgi:hypothetical protein
MKLIDMSTNALHIVSGNRLERLTAITPVIKSERELLTEVVTEPSSAKLVGDYVRNAALTARINAS